MIGTYKVLIRPEDKRRYRMLVCTSKYEFEVWEQERVNMGFVSLSEFIREACRRMCYNGYKKKR